MSTPQEYWDACLIKTWRDDGTLGQAEEIFRFTTGKNIQNTEPALKRVPSPGLPWGMRIRIFTAKFLPKINARLWDQAPEKDVALLKKLSTSNYDTEQENHDRELEKAQREVRSKTKRMYFETANYRKRNHATNWKVTK